ncbi:hypothetical protein CYMTET_11240 [Cymbomonas tetramitiformis]|uniref:Armadillo repeat-containing protein 8 n=1 Tax=Cymbomonas tetramitiformis TaxID=36881 RepID=A0AAE0GMK3_9CHLO|nr:hypothetical protein CYMTET_11240 [Cymbomonas tetramitiformis]
MPGTRWRDEEIVENLSSMDPDARLRALRAVKNQIIGNKTKKLSYVKLGAVPRIVEILATDSSVPLLVQSAAAVGSFACGTEEGVRAVLQSDVLSHMLKILSHKDDQVVQAVARSLKLIFNSTLAPRANMFEQNALSQLLQLLFSKNITVAEVAASVLARCCETPRQQSAIASAGAIPRLVHLLSLSTPKSQEAALDALASLTHSNSEISLALLDGPVVERICALLKDRNTRLRVLACSCLANMSRASSLPTARQHELAALALPVAVRLVGEGEGGFHEAPRVVAQLVSGNADMQKVACDAEVVPRLAKLLKKEYDLSPRLLETTLLALAALTERHEQSRKQLVQAKVLDKIVQALANNEQGVRISACKCCLSMSRSVKHLRTALVDSNMTQALLNLLTDGSTEVKEAAAATLCNMVLDFSPMKEQLLSSGGLRHLAVLAQAPQYVLRLNSMWALKNLLYLSKSPSKEAVMQSLSYTTMRQLLLNDVEEVQTANICGQRWRWLRVRVREHDKGSCTVQELTSECEGKETRGPQGLHSEFFMYGVQGVMRLNSWLGIYRTKGHSQTMKWQ